MAQDKSSAPSPEMVCINCKHYDSVWMNCQLLGFDGIRENPNMRCNVEVHVNDEKRFAFQMRTAEEMREEDELCEKLIGEAPDWQK
jgi:hypothetical protein